MAKDKADKEKKREKKEKKRSETDGVHKSKKDKKKSKLSEAVEKELTDKVLEELEKADANKEKDVVANGDVEETPAEKKEAEARPVGALVPFANPLVEDKVAKKVLKSVKKGKVFFSTLQLRATADLGFFMHYCFLSGPASSTCHVFIQTSFKVPRLTFPNSSRREQVPETRRQGSCQGSPQVTRSIRERPSLPAACHRHPRRRHLPDGCHLAYPCPLRRPRSPIRLRHVES